jgi:WD40 repeat protein
MSYQNDGVRGLLRVLAGRFVSRGPCLRRAFGLAALGVLAAAGVAGCGEKPDEPRLIEIGGTMRVAFSPDGKLLAVGRQFNPYDATQAPLGLWDVESGKNVAHLFGHTDDVLAMAFSPDGKILATGSLDATVRLWDVAAKKEIRALRDHKEAVWGVAFSPDGKLLATGSQEGLVRVWDTATWKVVVTLVAIHPSTDHVTFSPDGKLLAACGSSSDVFVWEVGNYARMSTLIGHGEKFNQVDDVAFSPDGNTIATSSVDGTIRFWKRKGFEVLRVVDLYPHPVGPIVYSPKGKTIAVAHGAGFVDLYDSDRGTPSTRIRHGGHEPVHGIAFSPDGRVLAGTTRKGIGLWKVAIKEK